MNMLKRTLAMMLVLCMLFTMAPITAFAEDTTDPAGTATPAADGDLGDNTLNGEVLKTVEPPKTDEPEDDVTKDDVTKDDVTKDDVTKDDITKDDVTKDDETKDDVTKDDVTKDDVTKDDETKDDVTKDDETKDDVTEDDVTKDDVTKDDVTKDDEDAEVTDPTEDPYGIAPAAEDGIAPANFEPTEVSLSYADTYRILHLDCGRKYFTKDWIKALINEMAAAGFTHLELAFGNDGLRFLLDDMAVGSYSDAQVTSAIQTGNRNYYNFGTNELTQSEMTAIITHANSKGIKIIPLLNNPGHMDAIVSAASSLTGSSAGYNGSSSTVDLENAAAVAFVKGLVEKYVAYFDDMGCNEFNFGADEYANDVYPNGSMGFGALTNARKYQLFVNYVNEMAHMIKGYGMVPIAFNDGIYFNQDTSYNFDTQIAVAFWTSGWTGYQSASASTMASKGHKMINVNGDYYYILGKNDKWTPGETTTHDPNLYTEAGNWTNSGFMGSTVSNPMGGMFCIWCDYPGAESETQIADNARMILRAMAAEMQGEDGTKVSDEVIPGGFNTDGTIAEDCNNVTVKDDASSVEVTGCDLTSVTVTEVTAPTIADTAAVLAWDITPYAGEAKYVGGATVKLPVPADWNTKLVKGFYMENGQAVVVEKSTCADGFCTFTMPHFSVGGLVLLDASTAYDQLIELNVGENKTVLIEGVDLTGNTYTPAPEGIATVTTQIHTVEGNKTLVPVESMADVVSGAKYLITTPYGQILTANKGSYNGNSNLLALVKGSVDVNNSNVWTITRSGTGYTVSSGADSYLTFDTDTASVGSTATNIAINYNYYGFTFQANGDYLNNFGGAGQAAGGWYEYDNNADWYLYRIDGSDAAGGTDVTFAGVAAGETFVTINDVIYKIIVHGTVPITIKYQTEDGTVIKTETVNVADNATTYTVSNFNHNGKYYTVADTALTIDPKNTTTYPVTVTEVEEDLSTVTPLTIEYWLTNEPVVDTLGGNTQEKSVEAEQAYSENGIDLNTIIPSTSYRRGSDGNDPSLAYWRTRLLTLADNEQTIDPGDDETQSGIGFTKIRYWNGSWAVYNDAGEWQNIVLSNYQLVAYYMNDMNLADEVGVRTSDWGKKGNGDYANTYLGQDHVSIAFQVVYEGGTTAPTGETAADLAPYTFIVDRNNTRGVGTINLAQIGDYQIWKVTAETGTHTTDYQMWGATTVTSFMWDDNEMTVWEDAKNPVAQYDIVNPKNNPSTEGAYANLTWNEENESILIRIYIKAVETEDSLKVVYYDEKFGDTLVDYNVIVPDGSNFTNGIVVADTKNSATLPEFKDKDGNAVSGRVDATGYGIVNALDKTQNFRTDLTQVPEAVGKYRNELYTYTGSEVSDDGMTITHYYTINTETLSPNFVADFGLPLSFPLSQVIGNNQEALVESVTVNEKTRYGTLSYNASTKFFTYTPTEILQNIDVLSINIKFTTSPDATLTNVGVTPATTVYYGEQFMNFSGGWTSMGTYANVGEQAAEVLGQSTYYGYDDAYANTTGASDGTASKSETIGDTATFTFTGTGIQVFANASKDTGYVSVMVKNKETGAIKKVSMVDTVVNGTANTDTTGGQIGKNLSGLPVVSLVDLTGLPHATYEVTVSKVMDNDPVYIDGIRVFGTVDETKYTTETNPFTADEEDAPRFFEARDLVLTAMNITAGDSVDYKTLYDQVYASTAGASAIITSASAEYGTLNRQDLLDNGPKNELYLFKGDTLTMNVSTDRVIQLGLKAPEGSASFTLNGTEMTLNTTVDMFYKVAEKGGGTDTITVTNTGDEILSVTLLKICDDPNVSFPALTEANIRAILANAGYTEEPEAPTYTMVELKGTDVLIDGTVFDYTGEAIEPAITVNVGGTQLVEGRDYSVTYTNNVQPGTATVTVRGIATASETLGYTGEVSIDYTINAPAEPEVPEETTKPTKPGKPEKPDNGNKPGENRPGNGNNKPGKPSADKNEKQKDAKLKITFVNLMGKKVASATLTKTGTANRNCVFSADEITANAPARRYAVWFFPVIIPYGSTSSIVVPVF